MKRQLEGLVTVITGGAAGIGKAGALGFAHEGAKVAVADVQVERGQEVAHAIEAAGGRAIFVRTDVSRASDVEALVAQTVEVFGRLDCAFNNAGLEGRLASTADCSEEAFDRTMLCVEA